MLRLGHLGQAVGMIHGVVTRRLDGHIPRTPADFSRTLGGTDVWGTLSEKRETPGTEGFREWS
jgi:hypothetical protein